MNGLLRNIDRNQEQISYPDEKDLEQYLSVKYSMPTWILRQWLAAYDRESVECMLQDFLKEKDTIIRCDLGQMPKEELVKALEDEGVHVEEHPYLPYSLRISSYNYFGELETFQKGAFTNPFKFTNPFFTASFTASLQAAEFGTESIYFIW